MRSPLGDGFGRDGATKAAKTIAALAPLLAWPGAAVRAHDWYPFECCGNGDCAPAETAVRRDDGSYVITARGMTVVIPADYDKWRQSPDGRIHICVHKLRSGSEYLVCAFRGPGV